MKSSCAVQSGLVALPFLRDPSAWPTEEMSSRGGRNTLLTGIIIGIFSGGGVALSAVSDNAASLVGVAISASLLPPLVNAGLAWAVAATHARIKCATVFCGLRGDPCVTCALQAAPTGICEMHARPLRSGCLVQDICMMQRLQASTIFVPALRYVFGKVGRMHVAWMWPRCYDPCRCVRHADRS